MNVIKSPFSLTLCTVALLGALSLPALAQEGEAAVPTAEADAQNEAPAAETQADSGFDMGEEVDESGNPVDPAQGEPQVGQQYLSEVFNDWALRCLKVEEGEDPCQMYQLLNDGEGNSVAEIAIVSLPDSGDAVAGATIVVPLETLLTEQLTLRVDGGTARRFPYNFCNNGGCVTRIGLSAQDIALFRNGAQATLSMVPAAAPDQTVTVTMSLAGFTAAYTAASE